jgi:sugar phosphate isomerase/epimerase
VPPSRSLDSQQLAYVSYLEQLRRRLRRKSISQASAQLLADWLACWLGPIAAVRVLGDTIFHVLAKDTQIFAGNLPATGVLDTESYMDERHCSWIFRTSGHGHEADWWKEFVATLRMYGYDDVLSIEHETA